MLFLIISIVIYNSIAFVMPKRISKVEIYASSLFAVFLEYVANYAFDFIQNIYGYFGPGIDILGFLGVVGIYPAINTIFLNYFPYNRKVFNKLIYIVGWSLFSIFYEWMSIKGNYFYHDGWTYWMSLISYPIIFTIMILNFKLIRNLNIRES